MTTYRVTKTPTMQPPRRGLGIVARGLTFRAAADLADRLRAADPTANTEAGHAYRVETAPLQEQVELAECAREMEAAAADLAPAGSPALATYRVERVAPGSLTRKVLASGLSADAAGYLAAELRDEEGDPSDYGPVARFEVVCVPAVRPLPRLRAVELPKVRRAA